MNNQWRDMFTRWYPPLITREELEDEEEDLEVYLKYYKGTKIQKTEEPEITLAIAEDRDWSAPPPCAHKWKETLGIYRVYKDCEHCGMKFEDLK